jgi:ADP-ribose pyrophosphatase YjhB (NUDIX family)
MTASSTIKVKAMALFAANGRLLVTPGFDRVKQKAYLRLPGGHIEFGERSEVTLKREIAEELGAEIEVLALLDIAQNCFTFEGKRYHEIAFIYRARFLDETFQTREDLRNLEPGNSETFEWRSVEQVLNGSAPLYPETDYPMLLAKIGAIRTE